MNHHGHTPPVGSCSIDPMIWSSSSVQNQVGPMSSQVKINYIECTNNPLYKNIIGVDFFADD